VLCAHCEGLHTRLSHWCCVHIRNAYMAD